SLQPLGTPGDILALMLVGPRHQEAVELLLLQHLAKGRDPFDALRRIGDDVEGLEHAHAPGREEGSTPSSGARAPAQRAIGRVEACQLDGLCIAKSACVQCTTGAGMKLPANLSSWRVEERSSRRTRRDGDGYECKARLLPRRA